MTVYKPFPAMARTAAEAAVTLARHENVESTTIVPNGERNQPKAILLTPILVTQQNAKDTVLKDHFQKLNR